MKELILTLTVITLSVFNLKAEFDNFYTLNQVNPNDTIVEMLENSDEQKKKLQIGVELESVAYINNGYYVSAVMGYAPFRVRVLTSKFEVPKSFVEEAFDKQTMTIYGVLIDYYFSKKLKGLWTDFGVEYGRGEIKEKNSGITEKYSNLQIGTGLGYLVNVYKGFYINPWVGVNMNVAYDNEINVGSSVLKQDRFVPLAGMKIGWRFELK